MSYITPIFLFAAGAAILPVLYHLIRKLRARKVKFSSLMFLQATPKALIKRRKLRDILLMILRALIFGLLAFVFARPFFLRESLPVVLQATDSSTVIMLDNSYSMQYGDRFEQAKDEALSIIDDAGSADEISVVVFSDHAEQVSEFTTDFALLKSIVQSAVSTSNSTTDFYQPFNLAKDILLNARHERQSVVLISDFQMNGWSSRLDNWQNSGDFDFIPIRINDDNVENSYINQLVIAQRRIGDAETVQLKLQIQSEGIEDDTNREVSLWIDDEEIESKTAASLKTSQVFFQQNDLREGDYQGYILLNDDNLLVDNYQYFSLSIKKRPSILCIDGSPSSNRSNAFFLQNCFSIGDRSLYDFTTAPLGELSSRILNNNDVVFLTNLSSLSARHLTMLGEYIESGGNIIISFGDQVNVEQSSIALSQLGIGTVSERVNVVQSGTSSVIVSEVDDRHPIFSVFSESGTGDLSEPNFREYVSLIPDSAAVVVAKFNTNAPFLVERLIGKGKALVMTSSFNTEWSNFPVNDVFLPFVYQLTKYALSSSKAGSSFAVGDQVPFYGDPGEEWEVRAPGGNIERITIDSEGTGWYHNTDIPGNYQAVRGNIQRYFSVNVNTRESELSVKDESEMYAAIMTLSNRTSDNTFSASFETNVDEEKRQKLWRYVLMLIIALLIFETFIANKKLSINSGKNS
ncbi:VWA domain-containing protein [Candidatus Latescibacterota bacterium]